MGKKACLSLDLEYDSWKDDYHEGDEHIDIGCYDEQDPRPSSTSDVNSKLIRCEISDPKPTKKVSHASKNDGSPRLTVVKPKSTSRVLYVQNPLRQPLFTDNITSSVDLLVHTVSYLDLIDVLNLSITSKQLREGLAKDGLYCSTHNNIYGILLPALRSVADRLLPLDLGTRRPCNIAQSFACETLAFYAASKKTEMNSFEPKRLLSINLPDRINTISCCRTQWEQSYINVTGKGISAPTKTCSWRSGVRLSYVTNEPNSCAIMTMWSGKHTDLLLPKSAEVSRQHISQERYLPPNTKHIIEAAMHSESNMCAILARPLEDQSLSHYVLSLVSLPTAPPGTAKDSKQRKDEYKLLWQRHISWNLFSSSDTHPICSFSSQGKYLIFGSNERFGVIGVDKGSCIFDPMKRSSSTTQINAYCLAHEFLFILDNGGKRISVYDVSNTTHLEPIAEGELPWSIVLSNKHKKASGLVRLHHTHELHRQQLRNEYQIVFCSGRIWVTGFFNFDLLCTWPRLLQKLRSQLSTSSCSLMTIQFTRMKTDLQLSAPKPMYVWNNTHLYVTDSTKLYCWRASNAEGAGLITLISGNDYIESIHCDGTKVIVATNCTFRNTSTRQWDGSGSITVVPIDAYDLYNTQSQLVSSPSLPTPRDRRSNRPSLLLTNPQPYSPQLQLYNKRFFKHHTFTGRINAPNGHGSNLRTLRHPISSSTESNYKILDMFSKDGRHLVVRCKKGNSSKVVVFDLYSKHEESVY